MSTTTRAGRLVAADPDTVASALAALGAADGAEPPAAGRADPPSRRQPRRPVEVVTEDGRTLRLEGTVGPDVPLGYHRRLDGEDEPASVIVSPRRCHLPAGLRLGGWAVQLYATRSESELGHR